MLYVLAIVRLARRELVWINVTAQPTANGLRSKLLKHSPGTKPTLPDLRLGRDLWCRCQAPITSHGYPRQAHCPSLAVAKRLRREADRIDSSRVRRPHRRVGRGTPAAHTRYYNESRVHRALNKDAPFHRVIERLDAITSTPVLGGLHHKYCRI
jgi:hypothetical protein